MTRRSKSNINILHSDSDFIKELSDLFYDIQKASLSNLFETVDEQWELPKELNKLKNNIYRAQEKYAKVALWPDLKKQIDDSIKKITEILTKKNIFAKLDNASDNVDMLQELKNRFVEVADVKIANIKLSDEIGKYLKYLWSRMLKIRSVRDRETFTHNMRTIIQYRKESNFISKWFWVELDDLAWSIV